MEQDTLTALELEKTWESDGVPVLTASVSLPQLTPQTRRARRFNRYYRRFLRAYLSYCEHELLPAARAALNDALAASAPFAPASVTLRYTVSCHVGNTLSLTIDAREAGLTIRRADTWDLSAGLPVPLCEFFPKHARYRSRLLRFAREAALDAIERGEAEYRSDYRIALRRALNTRNYYLSETGLCFFYPMYAVAPAAEGIVVFTLPYDSANGPFPPGQDA